MEETLNFDEYPEFARQMGNRGSRGRKSIPSIHKSKP